MTNNAWFKCTDFEGYVYGHICQNGIIRKYPQLYCSCCVDIYEDGFPAIMVCMTEKEIDARNKHLTETADKENNDGSSL